MLLKYIWFYFFKSFQFDENDNDIRPPSLGFSIFDFKICTLNIDIKFFLWFMSQIKIWRHQFVDGLNITILKLSQVKQDRKFILPLSTLWFQSCDELMKIIIVFMHLYFDANWNVKFQCIQTFLKKKSIPEIKCLIFN
jgi:hypothetical protein